MARIKLGRPLPPVKDIAPPSEEEIDKYIASWNANCPPYFRGLLESQSANDPGATSRFVYDRTRMRYIHRKTGRVIPQGEINRAFIEYGRKAGK